MILTSKNLPVGPQPHDEEKGADPGAADIETAEKGLGPAPEGDEGEEASRLRTVDDPPAAVPSEGDDMKEVFVLDNAPVAEPGTKAIHCKPGIYLTDGGEMIVEVVDGRYTLEEEDPGRRQMLKESLLKAGFRLGPTFPGDEDKEPKKARKPAKTAEKFDHAIELAHPDNTPGNLINASMRAAGKRIKIKDGIVKTDDPKVLAALLKKGFIVQNPHTLERETEPQEPEEGQRQDHDPRSEGQGYESDPEPDEPEDKEKG